VRNVSHYSNTLIIKFDSVEDKQKLNQTEKGNKKGTQTQLEIGMNKRRLRFAFSQTEE
jgi:hypothetical protein